MDIIGEFHTKNAIYQSIFLALIIYVINKIYNYLIWRRLIMKIPSGSGRDVPFFGEFFRFTGVKVDSQEAFKMVTEEFTQREEGIARLTIFNEHDILLYKAEHVKPVMDSKILRKSKTYHLLHDWLGQGLVISEGERWQRNRKMLTPAFHFQILEQFIDVFNREARILVSKLEEKEEQVQDVYKQCKACTLDIIVETSMGRTIGAQDGKGMEFVGASEKESNIFLQRSVNPILQFKLFFMFSSLYKKHLESIQILHNFSKETIKERKEQRHAMKASKDNELISGCSKKRQAFLDLLLKSQEENPSITDKDIMDEVNTFMFAGHDTTATSLSFILFLLGNHTEKQKLLHEELDSIFGDSDRQATADDLKEMKYLDCIIKESLRLYNPVVFLEKTLDEDLIIGKYLVPAGAVVVVVLPKLHMDQEQFPNPEEFKPERFLSDSTEKHDPFSYIPFSSGPRNCIGQRFAIMEEKVILSTIFRKFRAESVIKQKDMRIKIGVTLIPENDKIDMKFYRR